MIFFLEIQKTSMVLGVDLGVTAYNLKSKRSETMYVDQLVVRTTKNGRKQYRLAGHSRDGTGMSKIVSTVEGEEILASGQVPVVRK